MFSLLGALLLAIIFSKIKLKIYEMERHFYYIIENDLYFDAKNSAITYHNSSLNIGKKIIFCTPNKRNQRLSYPCSNSCIGNETYKKKANNNQSSDPIIALNNK